MNGLDWRTLWDLAAIRQEHIDNRLERERVLRDAGIAPASGAAWFSHALGTMLVAVGQRLSAEPHRPYATTAS